MHEGWGHPFMIVGDGHDVKATQVFEITCGYLVI